MVVLTACMLLYRRTARLHAWYSDRIGAALPAEPELRQEFLCYSPCHGKLIAVRSPLFIEFMQRYERDYVHQHSSALCRPPGYLLYLFKVDLRDKHGINLYVQPCLACSLHAEELVLYQEFCPFST